MIFFKNVFITFQTWYSQNILDMKYLEYFVRKSRKNSHKIIIIFYQELL
jgi:hypothetical protein